MVVPWSSVASAPQAPAAVEPAPPEAKAQPVILYVEDDMLSREVMRLLLKYREVVAPGALAERLLSLARSLRHFRRLMTDASECWLLMVALPEALSWPETERATERLARMGMRPGALLLNRSLREDGSVRELPEGVPEFSDLPLVGSPALAAGPVGVDTLGHFSDMWRHLRLEPIEPMGGRA